MPWTAEVRETTASTPASRLGPITAPDIAAARAGRGARSSWSPRTTRRARVVVDAAGVDMILVGDTLAMVVLGYDDTLKVTTEDMAHHVGAVARTRPTCADRRRPAVDELPRVPRGDRAQRGDADPGRCRRGEARGRPEAPRRDRRRSSTPRSRSWVTSGSRRSRSTRSAASRCRASSSMRPGGSSTTRSRWPRPAASASCSSACPTAWPAWSPTRRRPDDRHRRRPSLRRPGARVPRPARFRGPDAAAVRAPLRGARRDRRPPTAVRQLRPTTCGRGRFPSSDETYHMTDQLKGAIDMGPIDLAATATEPHLAGLRAGIPTRSRPERPSSEGSDRSAGGRRPRGSEPSRAGTEVLVTPP